MIFFSSEHLKAQLLVERVGGGTGAELGVGANIWQPRCEGRTGPGTGRLRLGFPSNVSKRRRSDQRESTSLKG